MVMPISDHTHPKIIEITFSFPGIAPECKISTVNFRVQWTDRPCPFLTMHTQKQFDQLLIYVNLYQHAQNQAISLIGSGDMVDYKILQSDWLRTFWPISQEQKFSQIWDMSRNTASNISFNYRINSVKIDYQMFQ